MPRLVQRGPCISPTGPAETPAQLPGDDLPVGGLYPSSSPPTRRGSRDRTLAIDLRVARCHFSLEEMKSRYCHKRVRQPTCASCPTASAFNKQALLMTSQKSSENDQSGNTSEQPPASPPPANRPAAKPRWPQTNLDKIPDLIRKLSDSGQGSDGF